MPQEYSSVVRYWTGRPQNRKLKTRTIKGPEGTVRTTIARYQREGKLFDSSPVTQTGNKLPYKGSAKRPIRTRGM